MKVLRNWIFALLFATSIGGFSTATIVPNTASAACTQSLLGMPAWYRGVVDGNCNVTMTMGFSVFVWTIVLNIVEMLLFAVGYIAVIYIIYGGFTYLISAGSPDKITSAKKTITNAVIGLLISIASIGIVNIVVGVI